MTIYEYSEPILLDANVLVYAAHEIFPNHAVCKELCEKALNEDIKVCTTPQILNEFFAIVTNPKRVTKPISPLQASKEVKKYQSSKFISQIYPQEGVVMTTLSLLEKHPVKGYGIFDIYLVATMLGNGVRRICTYNTSDFSKFSAIKTFTPEDLVENP